MKRICIPAVIIATLMFLPGFAFAQKLSPKEIKDGTAYYDGAELPLFGKAFEGDCANGRYRRLPAKLEGGCRGALWYLGQESAGLYLRFRSDSPFVKAHWVSTFDNRMNHMTDTGVKGLDLYFLHDGKWRFAGSGRPKGKENEATIVANMDREEREYMLYLSLYDGIDQIEIGIDENSGIGLPKIDSPRSGSPIVMYGTSILQGGCASRPAMAHTSIISRALDREVVNLGFSGNALLDMEIAELMAEVESPSLYVLDYVPNASAKAIAEKGEEFFRILRKAHPKTPVIFVEDPLFTHSIVDNHIREEITRKNAAQKELFERLRRQGEKFIYYVPADKLIGNDGEATVDGIHFTDLGMERYARVMLPVMKKALRKH